MEMRLPLQAGKAKTGPGLGGYFLSERLCMPYM